MKVPEIRKLEKQSFLALDLFFLRQIKDHFDLHQLKR